MLMPNELLNIDHRIHAGASALNHDAFRKAGVFSIVLCGGPGSGKTTLLRETFRRLAGELRMGVVVGNIRAEDDAQQLRDWCEQVVSMETIDLTAPLLREALEIVDLDKLDVLFIERASAAPPMPPDLGQSATVGLFSVAGGHDKIERHRKRVINSDLILLTKTDLTPYVAFDEASFRSEIRHAKRELPIIAMSAVSHSGIEEWCRWILNHARDNRNNRHRHEEIAYGFEYFTG
ncbi:hydrogenase nickel incorporation protein HypB [soil metagenome]